MVTEVLFYHLTRRPLEHALPELLEKTLARGWRGLVRAGSRERVEALNAHLWTYRDESFLPHGGPEDGPGEAQPIYLTAGDEAPNAPQILFLVDGAETSVGKFAQYERVILMFDGHDEQAVGQARGDWRAVSDAGLKAVYWAQDEGGRWVKKAESGA